MRKTKTIGDKTANGEFYIVKVKVFSDAKGAEMGLLTVDAKVIDSQKRELQRDAAAEAILVGDEDSLLRKRNYFKLEEQSQAVAVK